MKRAIDIILDFEEEQKTYNPFGDEFASFDDRFNEKNSEKIIDQLEKKLFGHRNDSRDFATQFLHESSSYILIKSSLS